MDVKWVVYVYANYFDAATAKARVEAVDVQADAAAARATICADVTDCPAPGLVRRTITATIDPEMVAMFPVEQDLKTLLSPLMAHALVLRLPARHAIGNPAETTNSVHAFSTTLGEGLCP